MGLCGASGRAFGVEEAVITDPEPPHPPGLVRDAIGLIGFLALSAVVWVIGGAVTAASVGTWYAGLAKPWFNPPNWLFAPVWTLLYVGIAVAGWRVWSRGFAEARRPFILFGVQMALNLAWPLVFFGLHQILGGLIVIVLLLAALLATAAAFWRLDRTAGLMFAPYAAWVTFASVLNLAIWRLN